SGLVDTVVPEPPGGAQADLPLSAHYLKRALLRAFSSLPRDNPQRLLKLRYQRYRHMGEYTSYFRAALEREITLLREQASKRRTEGPTQPQGKQVKKEEAPATPSHAETVPQAGDPTRH
ncbi:MAG: hypothetical protein ACK4K2_01945, partial [Dehalococcoidia bacterium]